VSAPVVIFSCQWAPHYAFQSLYRRGRRGEGEAVRVVAACVGRVGEDLVLEAFRRGAAAVWVLSCPPASCRHGLDHERLAARLRTLAGILATLGIPPERLVHRACEAHDGDRLAADLAAFVASLPAGEAAP